MAVTGPSAGAVVVVVGGMVEVVLVLAEVVGDGATRDERSSESQPKATRTKRATTAARFQDISRQRTARSGDAVGLMTAPRGFSYAAAVPSVRKLIVLVVAVGFVVAGCRPFPPRWHRAEKAVVVRESTVGVLYRQGVARLENGWVFSFNHGLFVTDDDFVQTKQLFPAIPPEWRGRGFNHIGDIDVEAGVVYAALEQPDTRRPPGDARPTTRTRSPIPVATTSRSTTTRSSPSIPRGTSRTPWMSSEDARCPVRRPSRMEAVGAAPDVDERGPLPRRRPLPRAAWLSTDDTIDGVYRVDLHTGAVQPLGSIGRVDGEGEGIDATPTRDGDLHVLTIDVNIVPVRLIDLKVTLKAVTVLGVRGPLRPSPSRRTTCCPLSFEQ